MYETYYGLTGKPFQLNPDPSFYYGSKQHKRAMSYLEYGLHKNEGFIVITGEIGAGKTTLVRNLFGQLSPSEVVAAHLVSTQLDAEDTLRMVASAFGIPTKQSAKSDLLLELEAFLVSMAHQGKRCLLVVDEAQNLTRKAVEELRMLSNFQLDTHALLQSFLIGQPEFRETLQGPLMEQLRQRVIAACHIGPLSDLDTEAYIRHRLACVGWKDGSPEFQPGAFEAIFAASGGIPRRINSVCDRLLWYGYLADKRHFTDQDIREVADEMNDETGAVVSQQAQQKLYSSRPVSADVMSIGDALTVRPSTPTYALAGENFDNLTTRANDAVAEQLVNIEQGMRRLDATMLRLERSNLVSTALFRRLLDLIRSRGAGKDDGQ